MDLQALRIVTLLIAILLLYLLVTYGWVVAFLSGIFLFFIKEKAEKLWVTKPESKCIFITGCDSGFGHNAALLLANKGFTVFAGCLFPKGDGAKKLENHNNIHILHLDVTSNDLVHACITSMKQLMVPDKQLWAVINNAGICTDISLHEWTSIEYYELCWQVNCLGVVRVTKACLPLLRLAGRGSRVITVTSLVSRLAPMHYGPYSMSKFAAQAFCSSLRMELHSQGIHVITIEPNLYRTPLLDVKGYISRAEANYAALDEGRQVVYQDAAKGMHRLVPYLYSNAGSDMNEVPAALCRAATELLPRLVYDSCSRHRLERIAAMFLPSELLNFVSRLYFQLGYR